MSVIFTSKFHSTRIKKSSKKALKLHWKWISQFVVPFCELHLVWWSEVRRLYSSLPELTFSLYPSLCKAAVVRHWNHYVMNNIQSRCPPEKLFSSTETAFCRHYASLPLSLKETLKSNIPFCFSIVWNCIIAVSIVCMLFLWYCGMFAQKCWSTNILSCFVMQYLYTHFRKPAACKLSAKL